MKDYFSAQSKTYATFRPTYPEELYRSIFQHVKSRCNAWDCATGNGQVAQYLAKHFEKVHATDISSQQLDQAIRKDNIYYAVSPAESTSFYDHQFDLVTVAQALHWFDRDAFYREVERVCKPGGILAVWGYAMLNIDPAIDKLILKFYNGIVGPYWDSARRLVEDEYRSISYPFDTIDAPGFTIKVRWTLGQLAGYLSSWSATQKFIKEKKFDPVEPFINEIKGLWPDRERAVTFPVFSNILRIGS